MFTATYTKIEYTNGNSEYGAFIETGFGKKAITKPVVGDKVTVKTKSGETHIREIRRIVKDYASGVKVVFVADPQIEALAQKRYAEKVAESAPAKKLSINNGWCNKCQSYCYGDCEAN